MVKGTQALPDPARLLRGRQDREKPLAIVLAGHNGSGKSTFWYGRLADELRIPLINADRLMLSILPPPIDELGHLRPWAARLRDNDLRWQILSQSAVQQFADSIIEQGIPFAIETVFSHWEKRAGQPYSAKIQLIRDLQSSGYFVALLFVGLATPELSILRVETRRSQGGHTVPKTKLRKRFPRTQKAIALAASIADVTLMFDNSGSLDQAFTLVHVQRQGIVEYDCRQSSASKSKRAAALASKWLAKVAPL
jgi:predicted ABC-type ATPase